MLLSAVVSRLSVRYTGMNYRKTLDIRRTLGGNKIVDHSDVVGASPVGAAPTTSSFSTWHLASRDSAKEATRQYENLFKCWDLVRLILEIWQYLLCHNAVQRVHNGPITTALHQNSVQLIQAQWRHMASWNFVIIGLGNGLSPVWHQTITLTSDDYLSIRLIVSNIN